MEGILTLRDGIMQNRGTETSFTAELTGKAGQEEKSSDVHVLLDAALGQGNDFYVRLRDATITPPSPVLPAEALAGYLNRWWVMPLSDAERSPSAVAPDPRLLRAQAEIMTVTSNRGFEDINGRRAYHYGVSVDPAKLVDFLKSSPDGEASTEDVQKVEQFLQEYDLSGEVWIDEETFYVHQLIWKLSSKEGAPSALGLTAELTFMDHNAAPEVELPTDAIPAGFSGASLMSGSSATASSRSAFSSSSVR